MTDAFAVDSSNLPLTFRATKTAWDKDLWLVEESNELLRLLETSRTMMWMDWRSKPANRTASYYNPQVKVKLKDSIVVRRVRGTYGGNLSDYAGDRSASTADMQTVKLLLNAVVSEDAAFMTADLTDFYLGTQLESPEYMWLRRDQVPPDIQRQYATQLIWKDDRAMVCISKGIYGLPQAGRLAQAKLTDLLARHGYLPASNTPCLFKHVSFPIMFCLVVDDFAIKYSDRAAADHLLAALRSEYGVTVDWSGSNSWHIFISIFADLFRSLQHARVRPRGAPAFSCHPLSSAGPLSRSLCANCVRSFSPICPVR